MNEISANTSQLKMMRFYASDNFFRARTFGTAWVASSFNPLNTGTLNALPHTPPEGANHSRTAPIAMPSGYWVNRRHFV